MNTLYAFYDLSVSPTTFDFLSFLVLAEIERIETEGEGIHVVFVHTDTGGFRLGDLGMYHSLGANEYTEEQLYWRLRNLLVPLCSLMPSCKGISIFKNREDAQRFLQVGDNIFPANYTLLDPIARFSSSLWARKESIPSLSAPPEALKYVKQWLKTDKKVVTMTMRSSKYSPLRNSNLIDWGRFARSLDSQYYPVVVLDTDVALDKKPSEFHDIETFNEASFNVELRTALYELSYLNMCVNNGPALIFHFDDKIRFLMFKICSNSGTTATKVNFFLANGWNIGGQFPFTKPFQKIVWEDDDLDVIQREFKDMCERIEGRNNGRY